jgi:allantoicase
VIIALGHSGQLKKITVDTAFFKGNYPDRCSIQAACMCCPSEDIEAESESWTELLPEQKLEMDRQHLFSDEILDIGTITHIRLNIFPDGGVSRLRLMGVIKSC